MAEGTAQGPGSGIGRHTHILEQKTERGVVDLLFTPPPE
jgi:hypothetical protein